MLQPGELRDQLQRVTSTRQTRVETIDQRGDRIDDGRGLPAPPPVPISPDRPVEPIRTNPIQGV